MRSCLQLVLILSFFLSCRTSKISGEDTFVKMGYTKYIIAKGSHRANPHPLKFFNGAQMQFLVSFDSSAIYQNTNRGTLRDINKLFGFSDNFSMHHRYSARFGWRWLNDSLHVLAYWYNNGQRSFQEITSIPLYTMDTCIIRISGNEYIFSVGQKSITVPRAARGKKATGYLLYPFFGGDAVAPHEISIYLKVLK